MGSMMRRLRRGTGWRAPLRRVAFDFETSPLSYNSRRNFGLGKTLITLGPDAVFLDESERIRDWQSLAILDAQRRQAYRDHVELLDRVADSMANRGDLPVGTFLAVDPGAEPGMVGFQGGKVVR